MRAQGRLHEGTVRPAAVGPLRQHVGMRDDDDLPRPLLLIDVDGVLNVQPSPRRPAADWQEHRVRGPRGVDFTLHLNPEHGEWLTSLAAKYELTWCTTWGPIANGQISPLLGLPTDMPVVPLSDAWTDVSLAQPAKTPIVRRYASGREVVWIDAGIDDGDAAALTRRLGPGDKSPLAGTKPCNAALALSADPDLGLTHCHIERLKKWLPGEAAQARLREELWREIEATWDMLSEADVAALTEATRHGLLSVERPEGVRYPAFQLTRGFHGVQVVAPAWAQLRDLLAPSGWSNANTLLWSASPNGYLEGRSPAQVVQDHPGGVTDALRYAVARALPSR